MTNGTGTSPNDAHLGTRHLLGDLKNRAVASSLVSMAAQGARLSLGILSVVVLNRLLVPKDFGLVAMVTGVMGFLRVFRDAGLSIPTVQQEDITHAQVSNLFWINVALSTCASAFMLALAPAIVWFFREPQLLKITMALAGAFLLGGLTVQHGAILRRQMRFTAVSLIDVVAFAFGSLVGIMMALTGYRYWSLVGQMLTTEIALVVLTWTACRWRPGPPTRGSHARPLVTFGVSLAASSFVYALARGSDVILIGRFWGPDAVGLYSRAMTLMIRPLDGLLPALSSVFIPTLSRLQDDPVRYRRVFLRTYEAIGLTVFPVFGLMLALADPLTRVLFGSAWEGVTPIFASFAVGGLFLPLINVATWIFYSSGRGRDWFATSVILSILTVVAFVVGLPFGPIGVALSFSISGVVITQPVLYYLVGRQGPVSMSDLWLGVFRYLPLWGGVCGSSYFAKLMTGSMSSSSQLLVCIPVGLMGGVIVACVVAPIRRSATDALHSVKGFLNL